MNFSTKAAVVRTRDIGNDRAVWLLTENMGIVNVYLKNAGSVRNKFASSTQLFCCGDAVLFKNKDKYSLNSFDLTSSHQELQKDLLNLALCSYFCEALCEVASSGEPSEEYLSLLQNCFYLVEKGEKERALIKSVFEMRTMTLAGFMPDLVYCEKCGEMINDTCYFSIPQGFAICKKCKTGSDGGFMLTEPVVYCLRHIIFSDRKKIFSFKASPDTLKLLSLFSENYFLFHMARSFKTLEFYQSLL